MGRLPSGNRKYQITALWPVHKEISRRLLLGQKNTEIAEALNLSPVTVSIAKNSRIQQDRLDELEARRDDSTVDIAKQIKKLSSVAIGVVEALMTDTKIKSDVRLRAATDILDRGGFAPVQRSQLSTINTFVDANLIAQIKAQARASGIVVETKAEQVEAGQSDVKPVDGFFE